ncbi:rpl10A (nucleomorph) [Hemiselmis andersenii]|uniref:Rpl10A n=1 Tax=Hemiselmis andersenii TaxID=464988 RepID=A9BKF8_HEMAN|nr:rpl10A [Hemiselmis andersenii]ABW97991.1 rpl10A [Hemiselmis andersenii]|mmetsp:Transcript_39953/g.93569  ORF Transcript_39953/g.93569 Transcript_39953/m.93569 type:complete len:218 (+) Transcript_39953:47-700(+)
MSSKITNETIEKAVLKIIKEAGVKKRKFSETIEMQIGLKNYDPKKDKRFSGTLTLPYIPKENRKVAILGDAVHLREAISANVDGYGLEDLKKFNKQKKVIKKFSRKYDFFLASDSIIRSIPRILGPGLNKAGKFPLLVTHSEDLLEKVNSIKSNIKFELKKVLCLGVSIGNVEMDLEKLKHNISLAINFLVSLLKKNWQNVKSLHLKSTMGKPIKIY